MGKVLASPFMPTGIDVIEGRLHIVNPFV